MILRGAGYLTCVVIALALKLSMDQAKDLLTRAGYSQGDTWVLNQQVQQSRYAVKMGSKSYNAKGQDQANEKDRRSTTLAGAYIRKTSYFYVLCRSGGRFISQILYFVNKIYICGLVW